MEKVYGGHYLIKEKLGAGSFGEIYRGVDTTKSGKKGNSTSSFVAIKVEKLKSPSKQLLQEAKIYKALSGGVNIAQFHYFGLELKSSALVIDLLGKSLEDIRKMHSKFSVKTVLMIADQMISAVEYLHRKGFIHGDIKPDNFAIGNGENKQNQIFIFDFGLTREYVNLETKKHIPYKENVSFSGTARYASINSLIGIEQSRRDDMEALAYVWLYLLNGKVPWMKSSINPNNGKKQTFKEKAEMIWNMKYKTPPEQLFHNLPDVFPEYLKAVRKLKFIEEPNYAKYKKMFRDALTNLGYIYDYKYDWIEQKIQESSNSNSTQTLPQTKQSNATLSIPKNINSIRIINSSKNVNMKLMRTNSNINPHLNINIKSAPSIKDSSSINQSTSNRQVVPILKNPQDKKDNKENISPQKALNRIPKKVPKIILNYKNPQLNRVNSQTNLLE